VKYPAFARISVHCFAAICYWLLLVGYFAFQMEDLPCTMKSG
jgi:hypothetical protein